MAYYELDARGQVGIKPPVVHANAVKKGTSHHIGLIFFGLTPQSSFPSTVPMYSGALPVALTGINQV